MKKHLSKKSLWQSLMSLFSAGIIIFLAIGSLDLGPDVATEYLGDGVYQTTKEYSRSTPEKQVFIGERDDEKRWTGLVTIEVSRSGGGYTEEAYFVAGKRHGLSKITYPNGEVETHCYHKGKRTECKKAEQISTADVSAFQELEYKYPWFLATLNVFEFDNEYVELYLDTLEIILDEFGDDPLDFDYYYEDAVDSLTYTPYDSIIQLNAIASIHQGSEEVLNDELRMAVLERYRSDGKTTYKIVKTTYPGYLQSINDVGILDEDFARIWIASWMEMMHYLDPLIWKIRFLSTAWIRECSKRLYPYWKLRNPLLPN